MSAYCSAHCKPVSDQLNTRFRKVLQIALIINAAMRLVESFGGLHSGSMSVLADAVDFAGDAANYSLSLAVLSKGAKWRAYCALIKGLSMGGYGVFIIGKTLLSYMHSQAPEPYSMGAIGLLALLANLSVAFMLIAFRRGDANMRAVWLCSRNDAGMNIAIMAAAAGVLGTGSAWPDLAVATLIAVFALHGAQSVIRQARHEMSHLQ